MVDAFAVLMAAFASAPAADLVYEATAAVVAIDAFEANVAYAENADADMPAAAAAAADVGAASVPGFAGRSVVDEIEESMALAVELSGRNAAMAVV